MNSFTENNGSPPELQQNLELLNDLSFFSSFPAKAIKLIAYLSERDTFAPGDILFEEGDDYGQAYLVLTGQLVLFEKLGDSKEEVKFFDPGDFLGSLSLLGSMPSLYSLQAKTDCTVLTISRAQLAKIFEQFPKTLNQAVQATINNLHQWERKNIQRKDLLSQRSVGATVL